MTGVDGMSDRTVYAAYSDIWKFKVFGLGGHIA